MTLIKKISVLILTVLLTVVLALSVSAEVIRPDIPEKVSFDYTDTRAISADRYDVDIKVKKNNVLDITETLTITYSQKRHGIFRNIPLKGFINIYDDSPVTTKPYLMDIFDVQVADNKFSTSVDGSIMKIKIGDDSRYVIGTQRYCIKYKCRIPDDKIESQDMLYWNFLPSDRAYKVKSCKLTVEMPKSFDQSKLEVLSGRYGAMNGKGFKTEVNANKITATSTEGLDPFYGATINIVLPEGYFVGEYKGHSFGPVIFVSSLISTALIFVIRLTFRKKASIPIKTVMTALLIAPFAISLFGLSKSLCGTRTVIIATVFVILFAFSYIAAALNTEKASSMSGLRKSAFIVFPLVISVISMSVTTVLINHNIDMGIMISAIPLTAIINLILLIKYNNKAR